jgi:hypothetical protein
MWVVQKVGIILLLGFVLEATIALATTLRCWQATEQIVGGLSQPPQLHCSRLQQR